MAKQIIKELVSVVIPSFNHSEYITDAILSVIRQSYEYIELIVVDDCSDDNTSSIVEELQNEFSFVFYQNEKNLGVAGTINKGLELASGEFIAILASDDYWHIDKIDKQVEVLKEYTSIKACATRAFSVDYANKFINATSKNMNGDYEHAIDLVSFEDIFVKGISFTPSLLLRADCLESLDPELGVEDLSLWLELTVDGGEMIILNKQLLYYRYHDGNSHKKRLWLAKEHLKVIEKFSSHQLYQDAKYEWSMRIANDLSSICKLFSIKTLPKKFRALSDVRFYKFIAKLFLRWGK